MSEYLGHELMKAIDASGRICGHPGHHFTTYSPKDETCGRVKQSDDHQKCQQCQQYIVGAITAVTLAPTTQQNVSKNRIPNDVHYIIATTTEVDPWNNRKEVPRWGVAELQKMSPPTTVGDAAAMLSNKGVPQFWEMQHFLLQTYLLQQDVQYASQ